MVCAVARPCSRSPWVASCWVFMMSAVALVVSSALLLASIASLATSTCRWCAASSRSPWWVIRVLARSMVLPLTEPAVSICLGAGPRGQGSEQKQAEHDGPHGVVPPDVVDRGLHRKVSAPGHEKGRPDRASPSPLRSSGAGRRARSGRPGDVLVVLVAGIPPARLRELDDVAPHPHARPARLAQVLHRRIGLAQQRLERAGLLDGLLHEHLLAFENLEARTHLDEQRIGARQALLRLPDLALALLERALRVAELLQLPEHVLEHGPARFELLVGRGDLAHVGRGLLGHREHAVEVALERLDRALARRDLGERAGDLLLGHAPLGHARLEVPEPLLDRAQVLGAVLELSRQLLHLRGALARAAERGRELLRQLAQLARRVRRVLAEARSA